MTVNHIKGATLVMPDGSVVETGGVTEDNPGYDLTGLIVGNEGTFGIVTKVIVNLTRDPEAGRTLLGVFDTVDTATETVSGIIAAGIVPAALEMLDNLMIRAVEQAFGFGFPDRGRGRADHRGRRPRRRPRPRGPGHHRDRPGARRLGRQVDHLADPQGARVRRDLEEPQVGLRRDRPAQPDVSARRTASFPAPSCPTSSGTSSRSASATTSGSPTSSTPATATSTRSCSSTSATPSR